MNLRNTMWIKTDAKQYTLPEYIKIKTGTTDIC